MSDDEPGDPSASLFGDHGSTTAPANYPISLYGFAEPVEAESLAHFLDGVIRVVGKVLDLERLDGVTVAFDYDEALARLDRGVPGLRALQRTGGEQVTGVAMAPTVLRSGVVKAHLVFSAPAISEIRDLQSASGRRALWLVAHECGHVADLKERDKAWPGIILQQPVGSMEEAVLLTAAVSLWEEYAACRHSAIFGGAEATGTYRESLRRVLGQARSDTVRAIRAYRLHGDVNRLISEAGTSVAQPLRAAAYLAGHLDGLGEDAMRGLREDLAVDESYRPWVRNMTQAARVMWDARGSWPDLAVFDPFKAVVRCAMAGHGMLLRNLPDEQLYVDVPFSAETMP